LVPTTGGQRQRTLSFPWRDRRGTGFFSQTCPSQIFQDERLNEVIRTSLASNYDLAAAIDRVEQARQVAAEARSQYLPAINYSTIISYGHIQVHQQPRL
jgi:outer membrane protein TolC